MGLDMIKGWKPFILALLVASSTASCIKDPVDEENVPTSAEDLQNALSNGWGQADPLTMQPNDFLFQETEQKIESDSNPFFVLQEGITISKKEETATEYLYTFLYQSKVIKGDQEGTAATREDHRSVSKPTAPAAPTNPASPSTLANNLDPLNLIKSLHPKDLKTLADDYQMTLGFERLYGLAYACTKSDGLDKYCKEQLKVDSCEIQCSNLETTDEVVPAPSLIKAQENCGGYANCSLRTKKVAFDWTIALKTGQTVEKQKVNYSVTFSPDLPFLARMTEYCYRQLITIQNQKLLVNTCTKLKNFKKAGT